MGGGDLGSGQISKETSDLEPNQHPNAGLELDAPELPRTGSSVGGIRLPWLAPRVPVVRVHLGLLLRLPLLSPLLRRFPRVRQKFQLKLSNSKRP